MSENNHTPTPEEEGGKMFTQQKVYEIVQKRLSEERERLTRQTEQDTRERELERRELALKAKEDRAAKVAAVKEYYQGKGITGKALDVAMKGSAKEIDALELTDGQVKDFAAIDSLIGGVFAGLVAHTTTVGAPVAHPPGSYQPPADDRLSDIFKPKI